MKKISVYIASLCFSLSLLTGCARDIYSDSYEESTVGAVATTYACTVVSVRKVKVKGHDKLSKNSEGMLIGAVAGGALGSAFGGGNARLVTGAAGALAGGLAGGLAQSKMEKQFGYEYTVKIEDGRLFTVVQGMDTLLTPGQLAYLHVYPDGRSRVVSR